MYNFPKCQNSRHLEWKIKQLNEPGDYWELRETGPGTRLRRYLLHLYKCAFDGFGNEKENDSLLKSLIFNSQFKVEESFTRYKIISTCR